MCHTTMISADGAGLYPPRDVVRCEHRPNALGDSLPFGEAFYTPTSASKTAFRSNRNIISERNVRISDTALHKAIAKGCDRWAIRRLVDICGEDVNAVNLMGRTPLFEAVRTNNLECVEALACSGARLDGEDFSGRSILDVALLLPLLQREPMIGLLSKWGLSINAVDRYGRTVLHRAVGCGQGEIATCMARAYAQAGGDINAPDRAGQTALHIAAAHGSEEMVCLLVDLGCDVDAPEKGGRTALHIAACYGRTSIIRELVELGANVQTARKGGETPLFLVLRYSNLHGLRTDADMAASIHTLLDAGADAFASELRGHSPIDFIEVLMRDEMPLTANALRSCLH